MSLRLPPSPPHFLLSLGQPTHGGEWPIGPHALLGVLGELNCVCEPRQELSVGLVPSGQAKGLTPH